MYNSSLRKVCAGKILLAKKNASVGIIVTNHKIDREPSQLEYILLSLIASASLTTDRGTEMGNRLIKRKPFVVDGKKYLVSLSVNIEKVPQLCVTIRANYGTRSFCMIRGLKNFEYYRNYGYWNDENYSEERDTIEITPKMIAALIQHAKELGWSPDTSKSNFELETTNIQAKALIQ